MEFKKGKSKRIKKEAIQEMKRDGYSKKKGREVASEDAGAKRKVKHPSLKPKRKV